MRTKVSADVSTGASAGQAGTALCVIDSVSAGYSGKTILKEISLILLSGEIFVLMGPNGAGKTSLVRLLTGFLKPESGTLSFPNCKSARGAQSTRLVPQDIALYPWLTARENCMAFAKIEGADWREAARLADHALALCQCEDVARIQVARLSGGFKRRVNIAAALIGNPSLLILDEPAVGVDRDAKQAIARTLISLKSLGLGIFIVTHDFNDADALAGRAGFLFDGKLARVGQPKNLAASVFGLKKRIEISLAVPPTESQEHALRANGACPMLDTQAWVLYREFEDWNAKEIFAPLNELGLNIREFKFREPGLEDVYMNLGGIAL